jgi:NAD(P)-dependent dehydrogenase (short-subunit alcohol dehydrogenase family)
MRLEGLAGAIAVVTGAGRIGRRVTEVLSAMGSRVVGIDVRDCSPSRVLALAWRTDVADPAAVDVAFAEVQSSLGLPTILVTATGIFWPASVADLSIEAWTRTLDVKLTRGDAGRRTGPDRHRLVCGRCRRRGHGTRPLRRLQRGRHRPFQGSG